MSRKETGLSNAEEKRKDSVLDGRLRLGGKSPHSKAVRQRAYEGGPRVQRLRRMLRRTRWFSRQQREE